MNDDVMNDDSTPQPEHPATSDAPRGDAPQTVGRRLGAWRPADEVAEDVHVEPFAETNGFGHDEIIQATFEPLAMDEAIYDGALGNARHAPPPLDVDITAAPRAIEDFELQDIEAPPEAAAAAPPDSGPPDGEPPDGGDPFVSGEDSDEKHEKELDLMAHLGELRSRLLRSFAAVALAMIGTWYWRDWLLAWFAKPIVDEIHKSKGELITLNPAEGFTLYLQITFAAAIILVIPIIIYQLWAFVEPALTKKERRYGIFLVPFSVALFFAGAGLGFYLTPLFFRFFLQYQPPGTLANWSYAAAASLLAKMLLVFGICFQVPVVTVFVNKIGLVSRNWLIDYWRHVVVVIFVIVAIITPTWDPVTLCAAAIPPCLLYIFSIWLVKWL